MAFLCSQSLKNSKRKIKIKSEKGHNSRGEGAYSEKNYNLIFICQVLSDITISYREHMLIEYNFIMNPSLCIFVVIFENVDFTRFGEHF